MAFLEATKGRVMNGAGVPIEPGSEAENRSPLDRAVWLEKLRGASDLEIALRLLVDVDAVRRHLRRISPPPQERALIEKHTKALTVEITAVWQRWLDEQMPETMRTTLLLTIVMNVAVRSLTPLVSAAALAGSGGRPGAARRAGRVLIDSICGALRRRVDDMIADEENASAGRN